METEEQPETQDLDPNAPQPEEHDDLVSTVKVGDKEMVPLSTLIETRKQGKAAKKEIAALRAQVEQYGQVSQQLQAAAPVLERLQGMQPEQVQQLIDQVRNGTAPSRQADQAVDDVEARELAEDMGLIDQTGALDVARGRRMLDKLDRRADARARQIVAPYATTTAQQVAYSLRERTKQQADASGTPYATQESIDEAFGLLPPELAANPAVSAIILGTAMVIDKSKGRTPKAPDRYAYSEPMFTESSGGRRGAAPITDETRKMLERVGLSEKEFTAATVPTRGGGRGIELE